MLALLLALGTWPAPGEAKGDKAEKRGAGSSQQDVRRGGRADSRLSADEAAAIARRGGNKVLDVRSSKGDYRVKLLTPKGRVRTVWVDGKTGRISR